MKIHPNRKPDFSQIAAVLDKKKPDRDTLFEFFLNGEVIADLTAGETMAKCDDPEVAPWLFTIKAFENAGYDYVTMNPSGFFFNRDNSDAAHTGEMSTRSINAGSFITNREDYNNYIWNDPDDARFDYSLIDRIAPYLPDGMKIMVCGSDGVLENTIGIIGYDNLCIMLYEDPDLAAEIFHNVGSRLVRHYKKYCQSDAVGIVISNDDWGFNKQTLLSPSDMRKYVFPYHKQIVEVAHKYGKYAVLHSCGYYGEVIEDVINDMKFDGRHSYEDNIIPIEQAYDDLHGRISVLGGIDVDMMTRGTPEQIRERSRAMLEKGSEFGGYALGTGNSVAPYIPKENYYAMLRALRD